jgi:hypothetical protein
MCSIGLKKRPNNAREQVEALTFVAAGFEKLSLRRFP